MAGRFMFDHTRPDGRYTPPLTSSSSASPAPSVKRQANLVPIPLKQRSSSNKHGESSSNTQSTPALLPSKAGAVPPCLYAGTLLKRGPNTRNLTSRYFRLTSISGPSPSAPPCWVLHYYMSETDAVSDIGVTKSKGKYTLTGSVVTEMVTLNDKVPSASSKKDDNQKPEKSMYGFKLIIPTLLPTTPQPPPLPSMYSTNPSTTASQAQTTAPTNDPATLTTLARSQLQSTQFRQYFKLQDHQASTSQQSSSSSRIQNAVAGASGTAAAVAAGIAVTAVSGGIAAVPVLVALGMGAVAGGGAVGFNSVGDKGVHQVIIGGEKRREVERFRRLLIKTRDENEGRPDRGNVWGTEGVREEVKLRGLKGLGMKIILSYLRRVHWRFLPRNLSHVDMRLWCVGGGQWNMGTGGWRVEREPKVLVDGSVGYKHNELGGARRCQLPTRMSAPDAFVRAMNMGAGEGSVAEVVIVAALGSFADVVEVRVRPVKVVFWGSMGVTVGPRSFLGVRRWETTEEGAFVLTFEPFREEHEKEWERWRKEREVEGEEGVKEEFWERRKGMYRVKDTEKQEDEFPSTLHCCTTVSPVKFHHLHKEYKMFPGSRRQRRKSAMLTKPTYDSMVRSTVLIRPGGWGLALKSATMTFLFGVDLIGGYGEEVLKAVLGDIIGNPSVENDSGRFRTKSTIYELEKELKRAEEAVRGMQGGLIRSLKGKESNVVEGLRKALNKKDELEGRVRNVRKYGGTPEHWMQGVKKSGGARGVTGVIVLFSAIYVCTRYIVEVMNWKVEQGNEILGAVLKYSMAVQELRDSIPGDVLLVFVCGVVGLVRIWEQRHRRIEGEGGGELEEGEVRNRRLSSMSAA